MKEYDFIWNDRGSGANSDVSIWRPVDIEHGFYPLGDTARGQYGKPVIPAITVSAGVSNALAKPISYKLIWNDRGSWADRDVRIFKLIPPSGYTCLGDVAVPNYDDAPDLNKYRYVHVNVICLHVSDILIIASGASTVTCNMINTLLP